MNQNNYALVEDHVQLLIKNANSINQKRVNDFIASLNLKSATLENQIMKLYLELLSVDAEIKSFDKPEFILLSGYQEQISKIIFHRLLFFEENQCHLIEEANFINQKKNKIIELLQKAKSELPVFTYDDFLQNKNNVVYYYLKQKPDSTPSDEYIKMRVWQNDHLAKAMLLESNHFAKAFWGSLNSEIPSITQIDQEIQKLQKIFKEGIDYDNNTLGAILFSLKALSNSLQPNDLTQLCKSIKHFLRKDIDYAFLTPENLNNTIASYIQRNSKPHISYAPILCYSLVLYGEWLQNVKSGSLSIDSIIHFNYHELFKKTIDEAIVQSEINISEFKKKVSTLYIADEFRDKIFIELERIRASFNEVDVSKYFDLLEDENSLKSLFISNCIFDGTPDIHARQLKQSIIISEELDYFLNELAEKYFDPVLFKSIKNIPTIEFQFIEIISSMVPDSYTIQKMLSSCAKSIGEMKSGKKPLLFILQDIKQSLSELFEITEERLNQQLKRLNESAIYEYTCQNLREIKTKQKEAKKHNFDLNPYIENLSDLLQFEFDLIKSVTKPLDLKKILKQKPIENKSFNFGYKKSTNIPLEKIITALILNRDIEFLDFRTKAEDLIDLLSTKNIDTHPVVPIYINCQTTQFRYIIVKFKNLLPGFNPTSIEKCGRFFSKYGKPYLANNLNPSKVDIPKAKIAIDQIFNQVQ